MIIKTGYFAQTRKYIAAGYTPIAITASMPVWFKGNSMPVFAPEWSLVERWKSGRITWDEYIEEYTSMLDRRGIKYALQTLETFDKVVFLCYEKPSDKCHRHLLAEYLNKHHNLNVMEFEI